MATNHKPNVLVNGTDSDDKISNYPDYSGEAYNVTITARGGNDSIFNAANEVLIDAGAGYDTIENNFVSNYDGWGNNVTILGGDGNDSIKNWRGDYVSIDGGSGRDTIFSGENNANYCTISGGTGDDRISIRSASNNVFLYKNGDGNDTIDGFNDTSTLSISGSSYSTTESGSDVIVYVGNGSILLTWTATLPAINIVEAVSWKLNGTTATYGTSSNTQITINGVKSLDGISLSGSTVTIANSSLNQSTVSISDGYTLKLANDVPTPSNVAGYWKIENGTAKYIEDAITAGYKLNGNQIVHDDEVDGEIKVELGGIASAPTFADNNKTIIRLTADNVEGDITIFDNAGGYKFKIEGANVVFSGGEGEDSVNASNAPVLYKYSEGDGNDFIQGFNTTSTLQIGGGTGTYRKETVDSDIILTVGEGKITLEGAAALEKLNVSGDQIKEAISNSYSNNVVNGTSDGDTISNTGNNVTINAGAGDDTITNYGTAPSITAFSAGHYVLVLAGDGNDSIDNSGANSIIDGGNDDDTINNDSYALNSSVLGGTGNDSISNSGEGSKVYGGDGDDTINNTNLAAKASLFGNNGGDFISTYNADSVSIDGGADNDIIDVRGAAQGVTVKGGAGNDSIKLSGGNNLVQYTAGDGSDTISGFTTTDSLQIGGGTGIYSTTKSGENIIVTTADGKITLTGAASLTAVNIQGELFNLINNTVSNTVVNGTSESDSIYNSSSNLNVTINGGEGSDTVYNYGSNAVINGGEGNDTVYNGHYNGDSVLINGEGDNDFLQTRGVYTTIYGGNGNDTLAGRYLSGSILADGGAGNDSIVNFGNNSTLLGDADDDTIVNYTEAFYDNETYKDVGKKVSIDGGAGNDFIRNFANQVTIRGGEGNDTIQNPRWYGAAENVFVDAGAGNDTVSNSGNNNTLFGGAGDDTIWNTGVSIRDGATIDSGVGNKVSISGGDGNDLIRNNNGTSDVTINGGKGNDTIENTDANVLIQYQSGDGNDLITGFNETSTLSISGAPYTSTKSDDNLIVTVGDNNGSITLSGAASLSSVNFAGTFVENITSNRISDFIVKGTDNADAIYNRGARVTIDAGNGNDTINNYGLNPTIANPSVGGYVSINCGEGNDSVYNSGRYTLIDGGNGNDTLTNSNWGLGATFRGGAGNDFISTYNDNSVSMDGGDGDDTLDARGTAQGVSITGGKGNDSIKLSGGNNLIQFNVGDGSDTVYGFTTTDSLQIGGGTGIYSTTKSGENIIVTTTDGKITLTGATSLTAVNIQGELFNLINNTVSNTVVNGTSEKDSIYNGSGGSNTSIECGAGNDSVTNFAVSVTISGGADNDKILSYGGANSKLDGGDGNDSILNGGNTGTGLRGTNSTITGGKGNDSIANWSDSVTIDAGEGNDTVKTDNDNISISGGKGNDLISLTADAENNLIKYESGDGNDTIYGFNETSTLSISGAPYTSTKSGDDFILTVGDNNGTITLSGAASLSSVNIAGTFVESITSNRISDFIVKGTDDADAIYNRGAKVTIDAGNGNDTINNYGLNPTIANPSVGGYVSINCGEGNDSVYNSGRYTLIDGGNGNDTLTNSNWGLGATFRGGAGNDFISTYNDNSVSMDGGEGDDTLDARGTALGVSITGGKGNDSIKLSGGNNLVQYTAGDGSDTVYGFRTTDSLQIGGGTGIYSSQTSGSNIIVTTADGKITLTGAASLTGVNIEGRFFNPVDNSVSNTVVNGTSGKDLIFNSAANVTINGDAADDYIHNTGNHATIYGGAGDDTVALASDTNYNLIVFRANDGNDLIQGFNATSTLQIGNGNDSYTSTKSGEDILVTVGSGKITIKGAASLESVNINGEFLNAINNTASNTVVNGTSNNDSIYNTGTNVSISGGTGNDYIYNDRGTSVLMNGGTNNDTLYNYKGNLVTINTDNGDDEAHSYEGDSILINLGDGNDYSNAFLSKNITVFGDGGNDTIKGNKAEKIFFNGGGGNDYFSIHNGTKNVTVSGNTGNDTISLTDDVSNVLIQYTAGDGNDYISGFNSTSTLLIGGETYSTVKSGDDIFVTIGDGSILLRGAATLESVNIISSDPAWTLDGTIATYGTYLETLITVSGVTSTGGLTFDGDKTVTVAAASLDTLNVSISGGYSLALGEDVATPTTLSADWIINGTTASYQTGTRNAGYSLVNNQIIYTPSGDKVTLAELVGVDKDKAPVVENDKIKLAETNFADKEIAVVNNDGKFTFEFAAENYGEVTFVGSEEKDTVTNSGENISFDLGAGKDSIVNSGNDVSISGGDANDKINNSGSGVSISGGKGNDIVTLSGGTGGNIFVYNSNDGKDNLYSFKANDTIKIIDAAQVAANLKGSDVVFNVGSGSITIKDGTKLNSAIKVVGSDDKDITSISRNTYTTAGIISNELGGEKKIILTEDLAEYVVDKVNIIDGSQNKSGVKIDGSGVEEISLIGGDGKDTLISGINSEFKLTGGKGNDVFVFKGGNGSISDYSQKGSNGKDKIDIGDGLTFDEYEIDGGNVMLTYKDGDSKLQTLTIEGGAGKEITIRTQKDNKIDTAINRYETIGIFDSSGKSVSLASGTENFIATKNYSKIVTVDGSKANEVEIVGNKKANLIIAGKGNSTLEGGKGTDTLVGGDGEDTFVYNAKSGNKLIQDFGEDDKISLGSGVSLSEVQIKGDDLVLKVGSNKITIAGGNGNPFTFIEDGEEKTYSNGLLISADKNSASLTSSFADKEFDLSNYDYKNVSAGLIKKAFKLIGDGDTKELIGSKGNDTLTAGSGGSSLWGGKGNDVLIGDVGADKFIFRAGDGSDTIQGFNSLDELIIQDKRGKESTFSKGVFSGNTLTLSIKGGGKVIFENVSANNSFKINNETHQISGKKLI